MSREQTAGVGRVREFAGRKATLGLLARDEGRLAATQREVERQGGRALVLPVDVADSNEVQRAADQVVNTFGTIDVWGNNAMTTVFAPLKDIQPEEFKQPEVAARAIYYAAHSKRREIFVGGSTLKAIYGQDIAPSFADRYLGRHGYEGQQTAESVARDRPDNLFEAPSGNWAAHGFFPTRPTISACRIG